jgi:hypothetical protein
VLTDVHGVTGRDIMDHLIAGERDPKVLAELARGRARVKIPQLRQALEGAEFFTPELAALLQVMLARIDRTGAGIAALTAVIERLLAPHEEQLQQAESMPGWGRRAAQDVLAETGTDMTRFPAGGHLASWAGRTPPAASPAAGPAAPGTGTGNRDVAAVTGETAVAAGETQTREGARHRRISRRRGRAKAIVATGNTQMRVYHKLLSHPGMRYEDLGWDYCERERNTARQVSHRRRLLTARPAELPFSGQFRAQESGKTDAGRVKSDGKTLPAELSIRYVGIIRAGISGAKVVITDKKMGLR